jgi:hypothetical protein
MSDESGLVSSQRKPFLKLIGGLIVGTLLVCAHAWYRDMTRPQFFLELSTIIAALFISEFIPISWFSLSRSTRIFVTFFAATGYGLAFWAVTDTNMGAITMAIGMGILAIVVMAFRGRFSKSQQ